MKDAEKELGERLNLNVRCTVSHPLRRGGIEYANMREHVLLLEDYNNPRMKARRANTFLCQKKGKFIMSSGNTGAEITCKDCLILLRGIAERG